MSLRFTPRKNSIKFPKRRRVRKASYTELQQSGFLIFSKIIRAMVNNRWVYADYLIVPKKLERKYGMNTMFKKMRTKPPFIDIFYSIDNGKYFIKDLRFG